MALKSAKSLSCFNQLMMVLFSAVLVVLSTAGAANAGGNLLPEPPEETPMPYSWTLKSGYYTIEYKDAVRVLVTEVTPSINGMAAAVRFYDQNNTLVGSSSGIILPGQPLVADFVNNDDQNEGNTILVRLEIDLISHDLTTVPVSTVEFHGAGSFTTPTRYSCAGPAARQPWEFSCAEPGACPDPVGFNCDWFAVYNLTIEDN